MVSPLDKCLNMCKANCSCAAVFYSKNSSGCYFVKDILGSLDFDATAAVQYSAHLKLESGSIVLKPGNNNAQRAAKLAGIAVASAIAVLVALGACVLGLRKRRRLKEEEMTVKSLLNSMPGATPHRFSYKTLKVATRGFTQKLGSGGFGSVYAGVLANGTRLAVKALETGGGHGGHKQFVAEVVSLGSISHVNIVRLCGYCVHGSSRLLVYEHVANGSLDQWLFDSGKRSLSWESRWKIALGTARGLAYLHEECRDPIMHLDIKPQNILLDEDFTAKVSDFGMSKLLTSKDITQVVTGVRGTPGYLAPEWLLNSIATKKCDVYSCGMVLLELISGRRNIQPGKLASSGNALDWFFPMWAVNEFKAGRLLDIVDEKVRCVEILPLVETLFKVALWCIQDSPSARPSISRVLQMLDGTCDVPEPPLDFQFYYQQQRAASGNVSVIAPVSLSIEAR
ncbi:G-type lectin S-receptor-like serine/threonine-protein kinase SD2-5 [Selaginella moellendorffii]|nr:G-type lectin S-receptor-like serine/threonine-protein kinase SD2-5 [Selaginella moellendorffii]|eukprot:XP_002975347.2 G-type lectin S-receptor-like serine/threonine-protein kinase SD2-5 [Selaginella moellendorffii]